MFTYVVPWIFTLWLRTGSGSIMRPDLFVDFGAVQIVCLLTLLPYFLPYFFT